MTAASKPADWYYDFISPFAYFAFTRLGTLDAAGAQITLKPVLFAAMLDHWGQKGPAEIAPKRDWTYRWCVWQAQQQGIAFRFPAAHPFNPLPWLRLAIAAGGGRAAVGRIFEAIWTTGADASDPSRVAALAAELGVSQEALAAPEVKAALRGNTDEALARRVFGVPTLWVAGESFWGADAVDFAAAYLREPAILRRPEMLRLAQIPAAITRKGA